ncbi:pseudouridine synthase [Aliikangiella sp. IMCC44632]
MPIAKRPSSITLPANNPQQDNLFGFLCRHFAHIPSEVWQARLLDGKIHWQDGSEATLDSEFKPSKRLHYYREVESEPNIKAAHKILFQNEHFLIADKPHFLPVTPGGRFVNECLLERVRQESNFPDLVCAHRIDRLTAGLVLLAINKNSRSQYIELFKNKEIHKTYYAVADISKLKTNPLPQEWKLANRITRSMPKFRFQQGEGEVNARSHIKLVAIHGNLGQFELTPITGKTHQLRLHMAHIGAPILNDPLYPNLLPLESDQEQKQLQLLAKKLSFTDPITQKYHSFSSEISLSHW